MEVGGRRRQRTAGRISPVVRPPPLNTFYPSTAGVHSPVESDAYFDHEYGQSDADSEDDDDHLQPYSYACPLEKYGPDNHNCFCGVPSQQNFQGGFKNVSRVKSHLLERHNPIRLCRDCGQSRKKHDNTKCQRRVFPFLSEEQVKEIKKYRVKAADLDTPWYGLLRLAVLQARDKSDSELAEFFSAKYIPPLKRWEFGPEVENKNPNPGGKPSSPLILTPEPRFQMSIGEMTPSEFSFAPSPTDYISSPVTMPQYRSHTASICVPFSPVPSTLGSTHPPLTYNGPQRSRPIDADMSYLGPPEDRFAAQRMNRRPSHTPSNVLGFVGSWGGQEALTYTTNTGALNLEDPNANNVNAMSARGLPAGTMNDAPQRQCVGTWQPHHFSFDSSFLELDSLVQRGGVGDQGIPGYGVPRDDARLDMLRASTQTMYSKVDGNN